MFFLVDVPSTPSLVSVAGLPTLLRYCPVTIPEQLQAGRMSSVGHDGLLKMYLRYLM